MQYLSGIVQFHQAWQFVIPHRVYIWQMRRNSADMIIFFCGFKMIQGKSMNTSVKFRINGSDYPDSFQPVRSCSFQMKSLACFLTYDGENPELITS